MEVRFESRWPGHYWLVDAANGMFKDFQSAVKHTTPLVDVIEDKESYHFYFDMPGLKSEAVDARVEDGRLTIAAERMRPEWPPQETEVHVAERSYGTIRRTFELPNDASQEKIQAAYKDGVLEVTVEKRPEAKSAKIQIN
jgi:HSP20 family protein